MMKSKQNVGTAKERNMKFSIIIPAYKEKTTKRSSSTITKSISTRCIITLIFQGNVLSLARVLEMTIVMDILTTARMFLDALTVLIIETN